MRLIKQAKRVVLVPASFLGASAAMADAGGVDVSGVVAAVDGAAGPIAAVGTAVLAVLAGILVFRLIKRVM
ncbi:major capsid protein [Halomonas sp. EGI 63088]|uniref:Major capsid protein n=1 Tax=Halomonas flagellata TaxID=2920385 RepID=A0ABS9RX31_9GAMM|nr:major capsid protein [Halomonas flagellata]MCH4564360.1 major capsid protein [Halomonas flagellata]